MKRPTRYKAEVLDREGVVRWEVLVHDLPDQTLTTALRSIGYRVQRAVEPRIAGPLPLTYSERDPANSVRAAREYASRHDRKISNVLVLLIDRSGEWVSKDEICKVGGDQGDKRARELRQRNWPIEVRQLRAEQSWHYRLNLHLPPPEPPPWRPPSPDLDRLFE